MRMFEKASKLSGTPLRRRQRLKSTLYSLFRLLILFSLGYIVLYPLLYMIVTSISTRSSFLNSGRVWIPGEITFENFKFAYEVMDYGKSLLSTIRLELVSALIEVASCAFVAYGFARFNFKIKKLLTLLLFLTILIPSPMIIMPLVVNFSKMDILGALSLFNNLTGVDMRVNMLGTPLTFYLPSLLASGLKSGILIFIYIQFFKGLPGELEEAAWIDGAGPIRTFLSIAVPSSSVVILTAAVFSFIWHWNDYFLAVMYTTENYPLAVSLSMLPDMLTTRGFYFDQNTPQTMAYMMAGCVMFVLPGLILYMIVQRWFVENIDRVGITG